MFELKRLLSRRAAADGLFGEISVSLNEIFERMEQAKNDKNIAGVLLEIRDPEVGRGKIDEFRAAIAGFARRARRSMPTSARPTRSPI